MENSLFYAKVMDFFIPEINFLVSDSKSDVNNNVKRKIFVITPFSH